jgi:hypothetical protein
MLPPSKRPHPQLMPPPYPTPLSIKGVATPPQSHAQNLHFPWTSRRRTTVPAKPERGGGYPSLSMRHPPPPPPDFFELPPPAHPSHSGRGSYPPRLHACGRRYAWSCRRRDRFPVHRRAEGYPPPTCPEGHPPPPRYPQGRTIPLPTPPPAGGVGVV